MMVNKVIEELQKAVIANPKVGKKPLCIWVSEAPEGKSEEPLEVGCRYHIEYIDTNLDGKGIDLTI